MIKKNKLKIVAYIIDAENFVLTISHFPLIKSCHSFRVLQTPDRIWNFVSVFSKQWKRKGHGDEDNFKKQSLKKSIFWKDCQIKKNEIVGELYISHII